MGFSRQEYWSGLPFPSPGDLPDPGIEPKSPSLQADALPSENQSLPEEEFTKLSYKLKNTLLDTNIVSEMAFLGGSIGKESACNAGDPGSIPGLGRPPGGGNGIPLQDSCLENSHGQRSLAGYSL